MRTDPFDLPAKRWAGWLLLVLMNFVRAWAADPVLSLDRGQSFDTPLLRPGKADWLSKHFLDRDQFNAFGWSPSFKGGGGTILPERGD